MFHAASKSSLQHHMVAWRTLLVCICMCACIYAYTRMYCILQQTQWRHANDNTDVTCPVIRGDMMYAHCIWSRYMPCMLFFNYKVRMNINMHMCIHALHLQVALCNNTVGSYECQCEAGYSGDECNRKPLMILCVLQSHQRWHTSCFSVCCKHIHLSYYMPTVLNAQ